MHISSPERTKPVTVFVHVHYPDIWAEMCAVLSERLTMPFHLVITTACPRAEIQMPESPALLSGRIQQVENRGRDILPFLLALQAAGDFDIGLKLHTKKSPQRQDGAEWRAKALDSLVPPGSGSEAIVAAMQADPRIGFVAPADFALSVTPWILQNRGGMNRIMAMLRGGLGEADLTDTFFAAGSMFWFRRAALAPLAHPDLPDLFEPETGQFDGTIAHAAERLFPVVAKQSGQVSLSVPALLASRPTMALSELRALARRHADLPSPFFPPPAPPMPWPGLAAGAPAAPAALAVAAALYRASLPLGMRVLVRRLLHR